jgi:hypothetical protein
LGKAGSEVKAEIDPANAGSDMGKKLSAAPILSKPSAGSPGFQNERWYLSILHVRFSKRVPFSQ